MRRTAFTLALVFLAASAVTAQTQVSGQASQMTVPVTVQFQTECTGFIASPSAPRDLFIVGGGDDDFHSTARQFVQGESVFISPHKGEEIAVGTEYRVIRPAGELFRTSHYSGQRWDIHGLGTPYEDVGKVRVTHVNPEGVVATITLSCEPMSGGDILMPFQPRAVPEYTVTAPLDHFAPLDDNKEHGRIVGSRHNLSYFGKQTAVYLNIGQNDGTVPGQRFRIYKVLPPYSTGFLSWQRTPPEIIGEAVVLFVQPKSSVAMVISSYREIAAGDYVEAE